MFTGGAMSTEPASERVAAQLAGHLGVVARDERLRRGWPLREVARRAGLSVGFIHAVEHGRPAGLAAYAAIAGALGLEPAFDLIDRRRRANVVRHEDPVHAAMGESIAGRLRSFGLEIALDDPFQHYQFAGRADLLAWSTERRALLHIENRTRFPNIQEAFGSYNVKRRYLPAIAAERLGVRGGWDIVTNVVAALWSSEVLRDLRRHPTSFRAVCPDPIDAFAAWWNGGLPNAGTVTSVLVLIDPILTGRSDRRCFVGLDQADTARGRYSGYADALDAIRVSVGATGAEFIVQ
jgi:transcriptional regulator with XRE-family HTH domain